MPRAHHPAVKAAAVARYIPQLADPIDSLAEQVGKVVSAEVRQFRLPATRGMKKPADSAAELQRLETRIAILVAQALDRSLSSPTAEGKAIRMALIAKLAGSELGNTAVAEPQRVVASDTLLTTAEAAVRIEVSRPYVSMLCDQGKLGEVVMTEGGHRRIRSSAVDAYIAARTKQHKGAKSPREAAADAGLYDFAEGHFKNVARESPAAVKRTKAAVKPVRKRRS